MPKRIDDGELENIKAAVIFNDINQEIILDILKNAVIREYTRNEIIFLQDDQADSFFVVLDGWVKLYQLSAAGEEAVVSVAKRLESFAETAVFCGSRFPVTAQAVSNARIASIPSAGLMQRIGENPELGLTFLSAISHHQHKLYRQVVQLKSHTGAQRVAHFLLELCTSDTGSCTIILPHDKSLIAGYLGMKPESLSRAFQRLRSYGVAIAHNKATIADIGQLIDFIQEDRAVVLQRHHRQFARRAA